MAPTLGCLVAVLGAACGSVDRSDPTCRNGDVLILMAQAVPSAELIPCISELPAGWWVGGQHIESGSSEFWLDSDRAGGQAVTVRLTESCDVEDAVQVPVDPHEIGTTRYEDPISTRPYRGNRYYVFGGGCVTYRFAFTGAPFAPLALEASNALRFLSRAEGVRRLGRQGLVLCGAGVDCPG